MPQVLTGSELMSPNTGWLLKPLLSPVTAVLCQVLAFCAFAAGLQSRTQGGTLCRFPDPFLLCMTLQSPPHLQFRSLRPCQKHKAYPPDGGRLLGSMIRYRLSTSQTRPKHPRCSRDVLITLFCLSVCGVLLFSVYNLGTGDTLWTGRARFPPLWSLKPLVYNVWGGADNKEQKEQGDVD